MNEDTSIDQCNNVENATAVMFGSLVTLFHLPLVL